MKDLTGQRFGKLVAIRPTDERKRGMVVWECRCDCGSTALVGSADLNRGNTRSCGCLQSEWGATLAKSSKIATVRDLTGQKFGRLTAIRIAEERKANDLVWECKCDCGNTAFVNSTNLRLGKIKSCGCLKTEHSGYYVGEGASDLSGQRFGRLTVIGRSEKRRSDSVLWECKCDCGNITYALGSNLKNGKTISCGCLNKEALSKRKLIEMTGQRFGRLTVIRQMPERRRAEVIWECKCDCGNTVYVRGYCLRCGDTRSCGCLRKDAARKRSKAQSQTDAEVIL